MIVFSKKLVVIVTTVALSACVTTKTEKAEVTKAEPAPEITADMSLETALEAGINYGGHTLDSVKKLIKARGESARAAKLIENTLDQQTDLQPHQMMNAAHLFITNSDRLEPEFFQKLVRSTRVPARMLGWQLAAGKPSKEIAATIEAELTRAIDSGTEENMLVPQMANAVRANQLKSSYTVVRQGLMSNGAEEFVLAMAALEPDRASNDFLKYLAMVPPEELRQLTLSSVNLYSCIAILKHMRRHQPDTAAASFENLYFYSVSRNTGLAELAQEVLESYLPQNSEILAQMLAKHPVWVQMAYLESSRRRMNPKIGLLLGELRQATPEKDVAREISEIVQ